DIGKKYFDERVYGSYIIPEGIYDYFILNIGQASGKKFLEFVIFEHRFYTK
ncbi:Stage II sporulation protein R, partial [Candidatus Arthromitus sp. SFB-4]